MSSDHSLTPWHWAIAIPTIALAAAAAVYAVCVS